MTSPRVLLVAKGLDVGGIERIVVDLAVGLAAAGTTVEVAVVNEHRGALVPVLEAAGIVVHALRGSDRVGLGAARRLWRLARAGRFDVVHAHGPLPSVVVRVARRRSAVSTSHTPWSALRRSTRVAVRLTGRREVCSVAVSAAVQASLPRAMAQRSMVIPHGVDAGAVADARRAAAGSQGGTGPVVAIAVASHRDAKNHPNLLRAVRHARGRGADVRLVAVGEGPLLDAHRRLADDLGIGEVVQWYPPVGNVLPLIAESDLLVVSSDYEGQPLVVGEALAVGVPVVATAVGRVPELVGRDVGRVVAPGDPVALGEAIAELALDGELRQSMRNAALAHGAGRTIDDVAADHLDLYRRIVER
jgi:glycosyltransferase involved in cell wall biosynthesis